MALLVSNLPMTGTTECSSGRHSMFTNTWTPKETSDDRIYRHWNCGNSMIKQTNPLIEISNKLAFQLLLDYSEATSKVENVNYDLSHNIFTKIVGLLLDGGISVDSIVVENTIDGSLLVRGVTGDSSYYFEVYFDSEEYSIGYEVICNLFERKDILVSVSGSMDFVARKLAEKTNLVLCA